MKIEKFLNWINDKLLNYPDIHFPTVKVFMDKFDSCLSPTENNRYYITINIIKEFSSKQIALNSFINQSKVKVLETELNNLKDKEVKSK